MSREPATTIDRQLDEELEATRMLLERPGRKVLVIGIYIEADGLGRVSHAATDPLDRNDVLTFVSAIVRKLNDFCRVLTR